MDRHRGAPVGWNTMKLRSIWFPDCAPLEVPDCARDCSPFEVSYITIVTDFGTTDSTFCDIYMRERARLQSTDAFFNTTTVLPWLIRVSVLLTSSCVSLRALAHSVRVNPLSSFHWLHVKSDADETWAIRASASTLPLAWGWRCVWTHLKESRTH